MATILLQGAGAALGGLFGPVGAMIGRAAGALAGNLIDRSLISGMTTIEGARLSTARVAGADEGTAINRVYGTIRVGGTLIWATRFEEEATNERSGSKATGPRVETFRYYANFAIGICEGPIAAIRRVWADGRELDLGTIEMRLYRGTEGQAPDPLIEAKQGEGHAPAYRGLAYVVFERLPLDGFGNRIPVLQFEVLRPVGGLEARVRAMTIIPGATEHGYRPVQVTETTGDGEARILNRNQLRAPTDWEASIDELVAVCPNLESVSLVVSWFGTDLRAGHCRILPGVETASRSDESSPWRVCGQDRTTAHLVSRVDGKPAYGGTPDDASVVAAIADLKARGLKVFLYPFLMMDVPPANGLPDPYGADEQSAFPWRGRITCHPAAGEPGSPDGTAAAASQIAQFVGTTVAADFSVSDGVVTCSGGDEGYRRMILHYAHLALVAGGVDGFLIGSELRGLTRVRGAGGGFPFVEKLVALAGDLRDLLGPATKLTYGADWTEYASYRPDDGSGDVFFNLDPLWASPAIDAVGIDNYLPLSDFRDEDFTAEHPDGALSADDERAFRAAITAGEGFDWYYASEAGRRARNRLPITDGLAGKHWIYRPKDLEGWWSHRHHDRSGGSESVTPSAWLPKMKPIWFTELGCPAIDRGGNQPNVFVDPKSAESARPYFSAGMRSDATQRRFLDAHLKHWASAEAPEGMVDPSSIFLWTWDSRPAPVFPEDLAVFADGSNWQLGHWLNGRLGATTLAETIGAILEEAGIEDFSVAGVSGDLGGLVAADLVSARDLLEPLAAAFRLDVSEREGRIEIHSRGSISAPARPLTVLAERENEDRWTETIGQDGDFPVEVIIDHLSAEDGFQPVTARSRRFAGSGDKVMRLSLPATLSDEAASRMTEAVLRDVRLGRRRLRFSLPPTALAYEPGDVVALPDGPVGRFAISRIEDGDVRQIEARETGWGDGGGGEIVRRKRKSGRSPGSSFSPVWLMMDLPRFRDGDDSDFAMAALITKPFRTVGLSVSAETENFRSRGTVSRPATIGRLTAPLGTSVAGRFLPNRSLTVRLMRGSFSSTSKKAVLNGANRIAVLASNGVWEIIGFRQAEELEAGRWRLKGLLRGLAGTIDAMGAGAGTDAWVVLLDDSVVPLGLKASEMGLSLNWIAERHGGGRAGPVAFSGGRRARMPFAPVHLRARRKANGDIVLRWLRAGRQNSDGWEGEDIPLDEETEAYRLEILDGDTAIRSVNLVTNSHIYTAGQELADFGSRRPSIHIRVRQRGKGVGLGVAAERIISL
jgi:hypothetical protein